MAEETQTTSNYVSCASTGSNSSMDCDSTSTTTFTYYYPSRGVSCPYSGMCSDYRSCCDSCRHNTAKRSYYEPEEKYPYYPYYPYKPYEPYHPWFPYTTDWDTSDIPYDYATS